MVQSSAGLDRFLIKARSDAHIPGQRFAETIIDSGKYPSINAIEELPDLLEREEFCNDR